MAVPPSATCSPAGSPADEAPAARAAALIQGWTHLSLVVSQRLFIFSCHHPSIHALRWVFHVGSDPFRISPLVSKRSFVLARSFSPLQPNTVPRLSANIEYAGFCFTLATKPPPTCWRQHSHQPTPHKTRQTYQILSTQCYCKSHKTEACSLFSPVTVAPRSTTDGECSASIAGVFERVASVDADVALPRHNAEHDPTLSATPIRRHGAYWLWMALYDDNVKITRACE